MKEGEDEGEVHAHNMQEGEKAVESHTHTHGMQDGEEDEKGHTHDMKEGQNGVSHKHTVLKKTRRRQVLVTDP